MAKGKFWKFKEVGKLNVHELHLFLSHDIDLQNMKEKLRKPENTQQL